MSSEWAGVDGGGSVAPSMSGTGQQGADVLRWWNPLDSIAIDARIAAGGLWAWRAQANLTTYGPGPANYTASLVSVEGNAVTLIEGNGAVLWAALTGWGFVAGSAQWLDTTTTLGDSWIMFCQYANQSGSGFLLGARAAAARDKMMRAAIPFHQEYHSGGVRTVPPSLATANIGIGTQQGYRNGVVDGAPIPAGGWGTTAPQNCYIGAYNNIGAAASFVTAEILAILICDDATAFAGADITAIAATPAGSMHNL